MDWNQQQHRERRIQWVMHNLHGIYGHDATTALDHVLFILSEKEFKTVESTIALECKLITEDRKRIKAAEATTI